MRFPIDVNTSLYDFGRWSKGMRPQAGMDALAGIMIAKDMRGEKWAKDFARCLLAVGNECFEDGQKGIKCLFTDEAATMRAYEVITGEKPSAVKVELIKGIVRFCRDAYQQGQEEATREAVRDGG